MVQYITLQVKTPDLCCRYVYGLDGGSGRRCLENQCWATIHLMISKVDSHLSIHLVALRQHQQVKCADILLHAPVVLVQPAFSCMHLSCYILRLLSRLLFLPDPCAFLLQIRAFPHESCL